MLWETKIDLSLLHDLFSILKLFAIFSKLIDASILAVLELPAVMCTTYLILSIHPQPLKPQFNVRVYRS